MTTKLKLTISEVEDLIEGRLVKRFEEIFDDIPIYHEDHVLQKGETHRDYTEDDGRERRWYICKDTKNGTEHCINYTFNAEWPNDFDDCKTIEIVDNPEESDLYTHPDPVENKEPELSEEGKADKLLWNQYLEVENSCRVVKPKDKLEVPKEEVNDILNFLKTREFSMLDLRAKIIPVCIKYKLEQKSFWSWIQTRNK